MPASQHQNPEIRHRNLAGRQEAAHPRHRQGKARHRGREPRPLRPLQGQGVDGLRQVAQGQEERQADPGHRDLADAGGRGQDHHHGRPHRRAQSHRQEGDAVPARAVARPVVRHEGRRRRRRLRPGDPDGGHQPPLHRRLPRHHLGAQSALGADRQSHLLGQCARHRQPPRRLAPRHGHERPRAARDRLLARRRRQRLSARGRLRHHGGVGGDGDLLPRQRPRRPEGAARQHHRRLYPRPQADPRQGPQGARRDDRAAQGGDRAEPGADAGRHARLHPRRPVRQHRAWLQLGGRDHDRAQARRLRRHRSRLRRRSRRGEVHRHQVPQGRPRRRTAS